MSYSNQQRQAGAKVLADARISMGVSTAVMAGRIGVTPLELAQFEAGQIALDLAVLITLADQVSVCMDHAIGREITTRRNLIALLSDTPLRCQHPSRGGQGWPRPESTSGIYSSGTEIKSV